MRKNEETPKTSLGGPYISLTRPPAVACVYELPGDHRGNMAIIELCTAQQAAAVIERLQGTEVRGAC